MEADNHMRKVKLEKITLNIGAGKSQDVLEKGVKLIKNLTGVQPVKTVTNKRIPTWGLRPGLPIGCKLTLRGEQARALLKRLIAARDNVLKSSQFDDFGNIAFGIPEYIDIPEAKYDPQIGVMGLEVCITLERPGYRIRRRAYRTKKLPSRQRIRRQEAIAFLKQEYSIKIEGEE